MSWNNSPFWLLRLTNAGVCPTPQHTMDTPTVETIPPFSLGQPVEPPRLVLLSSTPITQRARTVSLLSSQPFPVLAEAGCRTRKAERYTPYSTQKPRQRQEAISNHPRTLPTNADTTLSGLQPTATAPASGSSAGQVTMPPNAVRGLEGIILAKMCTVMRTDQCVAFKVCTRHKPPKSHLSLTANGNIEHSLPACPEAS